MNKREIIERIQKMNRSASGEFLASFSDEELLAYLHQLQELERERRNNKTAELITQSA